MKEGINLHQFKGVKVTKEVILEKLDTLYIKEDFEIDNEIIALLDITSSNLDIGKSVVIHKHLGCFLVDRTTKELINSYRSVNGFGFTLVKYLANAKGLKSYLPLVHGKVVYMPMHGATRNMTDWIGLHFVDYCRQENKKARFEFAEIDLKIELDFSHGDLDQRIHNAKYLSDYLVNALQVYAESMSTTASGKVLNRPHSNRCDCVLYECLLDDWPQLRTDYQNLRQTVFVKIINDDPYIQDAINEYDLKNNKFKGIY
jgi:hypothetical protein